MTEPQTPDLKPNEEAVEPQHVVDVLRYCMRQYAVSHDMTTEEMTQVTIEDLVTWCLSAALPLRALEEICTHTYDGSGSQPKGSKIEPNAVHAVWEQLQNPYAAVKLLMPIWPWIVEKRPPLAVLPCRMVLSLTFVFRNQTALQITVPTPFTRKPLTNGFLASLVYDQAINVVNSVAVNGIDALREKYAQPCEVPEGIESEFDGYGGSLESGSGG